MKKKKTKDDDFIKIEEKVVEKKEDKEKGQGFGQGIFMKYYTVDDEEVNNERTGWSGKPDERGN